MLELRECPHASRIADNGCDDLLAGFVTLTVQQPLLGHTDLCDG